MRSTTMNATTTDNIAPNTAAQEVDERALEAVTGGIIIIGGMPFRTVMNTWAQAEATAFQGY
jgi:hypothetical protein